MSTGAVTSSSSGKAPEDLKPIPQAWNLTVTPSTVKGDLAVELRNFDAFRNFDPFRSFIPLADAAGKVLEPIGTVLGCAVSLPLWIFEEGLSLVKRTVYDLTTITTASALALGADMIASRTYPLLAASSEPGLVGSLKVAAFVGTAFWLKTALAPYFETVFPNSRIEYTVVTKVEPVLMRQEVTKTLTIHYTALFTRTAVRYLVPIALTLAAAHYHGTKVKTVENIAYTVGLFALVHFGPSLINTGLNKTPYLNSFLDSCFEVKREELLRYHH